MPGRPSVVAGYDVKQYLLGTTHSIAGVWVVETTAGQSRKASLMEINVRVASTIHILHSINFF